MFTRYKSFFKEFTAKENLPPSRTSDRVEDERSLEDKIPLIQEYLKTRGIKVREVYMTETLDKGLCIQVIGGNQYDTEIAKALQMLDLDIMFDLKRIKKEQVSQTDDYKYYIPLKKQITHTEFQLYNSDDQRF
jgi:hypothetical protein